MNTYKVFISAKITINGELGRLLISFNNQKVRFSHFSYCCNISIVSEESLSCKFSKHFLNPLHCLADIVVACGIAHPEAFRVAEGIASHCCDMSFLKNVHCKVSGVVYSPSLIALSIEAAAFWEQIESSLRDIYLKSGYVFGKTHYEVASALECLSHILNTLLWSVVCSFCSFLADGARSACVLSLQFVAPLDYPFRCCYISYALSRHGVCLGHSVYDDCPFFHSFKLCNALVMSHIVDMLIYLIGEYEEPIV